MCVRVKLQILNCFIEILVATRLCVRKRHGSVNKRVNNLFYQDCLRAPESWESDTDQASILTTQTFIHFQI